MTKPVLFLLLLLAAAVESQSLTLPAARSAASTPEEDANLVPFLDELFAEASETLGFSGAILVAKDGQPIFSNAAGAACRNYSVPNTVQTRFNLASLSKIFTGVAIVQLAQADKIDFEDKVGDYLPEYPNEMIRNGVTIHQLLTHTSGIGSWWEEFYAASNWASLKTTSDFDNLINRKPLQFTPGERFHYSNGGPLVLGLILEKISGMSYEEYIQEHIFTPAGMRDSGFFDSEDPVENLAFGYTKIDQRTRESLPELTSNLFQHPTKGGPAGGAYSTVEDLLRFSNALLNYRLTDREHLDILTTGKVASDIKGVEYAYLFQDIEMDGKRIVGHSGGSAGVSAVMDMHLHSGYTVIILSNMDKGYAALLGPIFNRLMQE